MELQEVGVKYGIETATARIESADKIKKLNPPQAEAIAKGLLDGKNLVLSIPTGSGKTLVAELAAMQHALSQKGKVLYTTPLRALSSEKYEDMKEKYGKLAKIALSIGDYDKADPRLKEYDLIITSNEKLDSLLRHNPGWMRQISLLIVDEVHLIDSADRGPTLEIVITKLREQNPKMQILALSATIANGKEIADWLGAELVESDYRAVPLDEGVYLEGEIAFKSGERAKPKGTSESEVLLLSEDSVREGYQTLTFVSSRTSAEAVAEKLSRIIQKYLKPPERTELKKTSEEILDALESPTGQCKKLARAVEQGCAFHHAGLPNAQRSIVEKAFKKNLIKAIAATPTLAAGINLPARRVIIRDYKRFSGSISDYIPVLEYKQFCGRAGRIKYDNRGESVLIAKKLAEFEVLWDRYIEGTAEDVYSKLGVEPVLRMHALGTVSEGSMRISEVEGFFSKTFYGHQYSDDEKLNVLIGDVLDQLEEWGFVSRTKDLIEATKIGRRVSELYIDPLTAKRLIDYFQRKKRDPFSLLVEISLSTEMPRNTVRKSEEELIYSKMEEHAEYLKVPKAGWDVETYAGAVKHALVLESWTEETSENDILEKHNTAPGILRARVETANWLLYSCCELAKLLQSRILYNECRSMRTRIIYGIKEELLPLVQFKGIGRVRARRLWNDNLRTTGALKKAEFKKLDSLLGHSAAVKLKEQLGQAAEAEKPKKDLLDY